MKFVERGTPDWTACAELVQGVFFAGFQVTATPDPDCFLAYIGEDKTGAERILACAGFTFPENGPMYLERYLDASIEASISAAEACEVDRAQVLQIGSIASLRAHAGAELIKAVPFVVMCLGYTYAAMTINAKLSAVMQYLGIVFHHLADADPQRLSSEELATWGSYYDSNPVVGYAHVMEHVPMLLGGIGRYRLDSIDLSVRQNQRREMARV
jgi:hypothetical protein